MDATQRKRLELILANQVVVMGALHVLFGVSESTRDHLQRRRLRDSIEATRNEVEPPPFERDF